jgi:predicted ferric reductase
MALAIASAMTPYLKEITKSFGRSFIQVHHVFAVFGLVFATLHPVFFAIQETNLAVFIPRFDDWYTFWSLAGRPALYIIYIITVAALLRLMIPKYWRYFHMLIYIVLIFVIVHANLIGTDFTNNLGILIIMNILFVIAFAAFFLKRYQTYQRQKRMAARKQAAKE